MTTAADDWSEKSRALRELLARTGLGDRAAFAELYRRTSAHLFGVVLRINRDRAQAEDVLQEAYVNVWRAASGFDAARAQPLTWLTRIARSAVARRARTRSRWRSRRRCCGGCKIISLTTWPWTSVRGKSRPAWR